MRASVVLVAVLLAGCAIAPPEIRGPYAARFNNDDVHQIATLVAHHPKLAPDIISLWAIRPDVIRVQTVHQFSGNGPEASCIAVRHHGRWSIVESSISEMEYVVWTE